MRLPIQASKTPNSGGDPTRKNSRAHKLEGVSILVVDDESDSREVLAEILRQYGAETSTAPSAHDALVEIDRSKPQVLLSDIGMPHVDGFELIRRVRKQIPEADMIALALTGLGGKKDMERALVEGFQQCIVKPVQPESLVETIERLLVSRPHTPPAR